MSPEEFKIIIEALKGIADGTITAVVTYMVLHFVIPLFKYSIICFTTYKCLDLFTTRVKVERVKK